MREGPRHHTEWRVAQPREGEAAGGARALGRRTPTRHSPQKELIVTLYTRPPSGATVCYTDELGPVSPPTFPPALGWSSDGHRIKAPLDYGRGPDKVWRFGDLRVRDGQAGTVTGRLHNMAGYRQLLEALASSRRPLGRWSHLSIRRVTCSSLPAE
jgi:hypothetical protein